MFLWASGFTCFWWTSSIVSCLICMSSHWSSRSSRCFFSAYHAHYISCDLKSFLIYTLKACSRTCSFLSWNRTSCCCWHNIFTAPVTPTAASKHIYCFECFLIISRCNICWWLTFLMISYLQSSLTPQPLLPAACLLCPAAACVDRSV